MEQGVSSYGLVQWHFASGLICRAGTVLGPWIDVSAGTAAPVIPSNTRPINPAPQSVYHGYTE